MVGSGKASIASIAEISRANVADMGSMVPEPVRALASLGSWGSHTQNQERDLHKWLKGLHQLNLQTYDVDIQLEAWGAKQKFYYNQHVKSFLTPKWVNLPLLGLQAPNEPGLRSTTIPFLLPHEIFQALWEAGKCQVGAFCINPSNLKKPPHNLEGLSFPKYIGGTSCFPLCSLIYPCWVVRVAGKFRISGTIAFNKKNG